MTLGEHVQGEEQRWSPGRGRKSESGQEGHYVHCWQCTEIAVILDRPQWIKKKSKLRKSFDKCIDNRSMRCY